MSVCYSYFAMELPIMFIAHLNPNVDELLSSSIKRLTEGLRK